MKFTNFKWYLLALILLVSVLSRNSFSQNGYKLTHNGLVDIKDHVDYCDFCLCSQGISPLDFSGRGIRIDQRYLVIDKLVNNSTTTENIEGSYEKHLTFQVSGIYSFNHKFSVIGIVPYSIRTGRENLSSPVTQTKGIGDVVLFGRYFPLEKHTMRTTFLFSTQLGIKLPTGRANEKDANNELIDPHLQLGTGSTDLLLGTNALYSVKKLSITNNLLLGIRSRGVTGYRFGNTLNYDLNFGYRMYQSDIGENILVLNAGVKGELRGKESQHGIYIGDSGGNTLYISTGANFFLTQQFEIEAQFNIPVYYHLYGIQDGETYRLSTGVQFIF